VATDDERIREVVEGFGGVAVMTSPEHVSGTDRVAEAVRGDAVDIVVNIQGDEPLLQPHIIEDCLAPMKRDRSIQMATAMVRVETEAEFSNPAVVKVVCDLKGNALYFSRSLLPYPRNRTADFRVYEHLGLYAYTKTCLLRFSTLAPTPLERIEGLEQLRALENGIAIRVVEIRSEGEMVSVDTPQDLENVRRILAARQPK
jgi:3-deoxy-manno-octulosonate cytidylyltransferase (CMP-KDO synthetase)